MPHCLTQTAKLVSMEPELSALSVTTQSLHTEQEGGREGGWMDGERGGGKEKEREEGSEERKGARRKERDGAAVHFGKAVQTH